MSLLSKHRDQATAASARDRNDRGCSQGKLPTHGHDEISILSLSSSDYPYFEPLVKRLQAEFNPLGVNVTVPSLRVNEQLRTLPELIGSQHRGSLTLAREVARDDMREQIRKKIKNTPI